MKLSNSISPLKPRLAERTESTESTDWKAHTVADPFKDDLLVPPLSPIAANHGTAVLTLSPQPQLPDSVESTLVQIIENGDAKRLQLYAALDRSRRSRFRWIPIVGWIFKAVKERIYRNKLQKLLDVVAQQTRARLCEFSIAKLEVAFGNRNIGELKTTLSNPDGTFAKENTEQIIALVFERCAVERTGLIGKEVHKAATSFFQEVREIHGNEDVIAKDQVRTFAEENGAAECASLGDLLVEAHRDYEMPTYVQGMSFIAQASLEANSWDVDAATNQYKKLVADLGSSDISPFNVDLNAIMQQCGSRPYKNALITQLVCVMPGLGFTSLNSVDRVNLFNALVDSTDPLKTVCDAREKFLDKVKAEVVAELKEGEELSDIEIRMIVEKERLAREFVGFITPLQSEYGESLIPGAQP